MFSYLRPNNRRSAIPSVAAPPQASASRYYHDAAASPPPPSSDFNPLARQASHVNSLDDASPVSPDPPILPPIPRVASHHQRNTSEAESFWGPDQNANNTETRKPRPPQELPSRLPETDSNAVPRPAPTAKQQRDNTALQAESLSTTEAQKHPQPTQSRRKRPIDLAYESMRAYTEPPRRQSFGNTQDNASFLPHPSRAPPPPPPKSTNPQPPQRQAPPPPVRTQPQAPAIAKQKSHGKARLNLLNPISLLARRRSSQAVEEAYSQSQSTPRLPDDFDPRIRGKVVHDFSAPKPSRPVSSNEPAKEWEGLSEAKRKRPSPNGRSGTNQDDHSPSSTEKEHTPVFKENFEDNVEPWSSAMETPAKKRSSAFMYQVSLQSSQPPDPSSLPAFARNLPSNVTNEIDALRKASSPPPKTHLEILLEPPAANQKSATSSPPTSPPKTRSRATSVNDSPFQTTGAPQRFKSNASRFSFDLAGVGSAAQEKLLEEKHRQKAKRKERESIQSMDQDLDDDDAYADYDDMEDDGLEEKIPGVNADADDPDMPALQQSLENVQFISPNKSSFDSVTSQISTGLTSPATPRDGQGHTLGYASKSSPDLLHLQPRDQQILSRGGILRPKSTPSGAIDTGLSPQPLQQDLASEINLAGLPQQYDQYDSPNDDDMYFDDGIIEDFGDGEAQPFDESVFDDDTNRVYGLPVRDLKPLPGPSSQTRFPKDKPSNEAEDSSHLITGPEDSENTHPQPEASNDEDAIAEMRDSIADLNQPARTTSTSNAAGLTHDNLGLHDRLAFAANRAALEGRFNRTYSQASTHESHDGRDSSQGTATQENLLSSQIDGLLISRGVNDDNDFSFDDAENAFTEAEDDDPIIAAANAEALENDDEGFYGQEFGFFARKPGSSQAEYANGGYFGARALEGLHRMNSGRNNLEPSLTPITERSEWSNRNSMVSLGMHGFPLSSQYQSNQQLTDLMRVQEGEEMSLEALRKLRRGAWGGSNGSLQSSSNSQNGGSPLTYLPPGMVAPFMQQTNSNGSLMSPNSQNLAGSFHSFSSGGPASSNDSDPSPSGDSPTITMSPSNSGLMLHLPPQPMGPPPPPPADSSPVKRSAMNPPKTTWVPGHSRNSSGAESVSYREENGRWFCERTRVIDAETGEVEVLGRTVVEGGRI